MISLRDWFVKGNRCDDGGDGCPICGPCGRRMAKNGTCVRRIHHRIGSEHLKIQRFICTKCGCHCTDAPMWTLRYCRYALWAVEGMLVERILEGSALRALAVMLALGGVCERTVGRLLKKFEEFAADAIIGMAAYVADENPDDSALLEPIVTRDQKSSQLTRFVNALYTLASVHFKISDKESSNGKLLFLHQVWRRGLWPGSAGLLDIS